MKFKFICFLIIILKTSLIFANDFNIRYSLPHPETRTIDGIEYKCLDTKQWQQVLLIGNEYHGLYDWRLEYKQATNLLEQIQNNHELIISGYEKINTIYENDRKYLQARISEEHDWGLKIQKSGSLSILTWQVISGVELAGIIALSILAVVH
jgi:hypothetical protein